jgi:hypothetical protein
MDHEAMRAAYLRALDFYKTVFTSFCNICKNEYKEKTGEIVDVVSSNTVYKIWYCDNCMSTEDQFD